MSQWYIAYEKNGWIDGWHWNAGSLLINHLLIHPFSQCCYHMTQCNPKFIPHGYNKNWTSPCNKVCGANMGQTWLLSVPDGPHVGSWTLLSGLPYCESPNDTSGLFYKEIHLQSAKCPLKTNGCSANLKLTSLVKEVTDISLTNKLWNTFCACFIQNAYAMTEIDCIYNSYRNNFWPVWSVSMLSPHKKTIMQNIYYWRDVNKKKHFTVASTVPF